MLSASAPWPAFERTSASWNWASTTACGGSDGLLLLPGELCLRLLLLGWRWCCGGLGGRRWRGGLNLKCWLLGRRGRRGGGRRGHRWRRWGARDQQRQSHRGQRTHASQSASHAPVIVTKQPAGVAKVTAGSCVAGTGRAGTFASAAHPDRGRRSGDTERRGR